MPDPMRNIVVFAVLLAVALAVGYFAMTLLAKGA